MNLFWRSKWIWGDATASGIECKTEAKERSKEKRIHVGEKVWQKRWVEGQ